MAQTAEVSIWVPALQALALGGPALLGLATPSERKGAPVFYAWLFGPPMRGCGMSSEEFGKVDILSTFRRTARDELGQDFVGACGPLKPI